MRLDGAVLDARTDAPIAGATVTPGRFGQYKTDAAGRFSVEFQWISGPTVTVTKLGYVTGITRCGSRVRDNQGILRCPEVVLRLVRMGAVTGNIVDARGRPAARSSVTLTSLSFELRGGAVETDGQGHFQIEAEPDSYIICAKSQEEVEREIRIPQNETGAIPVSRCYQSAANPEEADAVTVTSGEIAGPLTIHLGQATRVFAISGRLLTAVRKVKPWYARIWAVPDGSASRELEGQIDARTGVFRIPALRTGMYTVVAMAGQESECDTCGGGSPFYATTRVRVERDIRGVTLTLRRKATVSGEIVIKGGSDSRIEDQPVELDSRLTGALRNSLLAVTGPDRHGRFEFTDVAQGLYRIRAGAYPEYEIATVQLNGKQLDPDSFAVRSTNVSGLRITLRPTDALLKPILSFPVTDWHSRNYWVLAIPEADWQNWERWIESRIDSPEAAVGPMPAGVYLVLLIDSKQMYSMDKCADEIRLHRKEAVRVVLRNGVTESVTLRAIRVD